MLAALMAPATSSFAVGTATPTPIFPFPCNQRLGPPPPRRGELSTSISRPIAVEVQSAPVAARYPRIPRLELLPLLKPKDARGNSLPAAVPKVPAVVRRVVLRAEPPNSEAPGATTLRRALGLGVPMPTLPLATQLKASLSPPLLVARAPPVNP